MLLEAFQCDLEFIGLTRDNVLWVVDTSAPHYFLNYKMDITYLLDGPFHDITTHYHLLSLSKTEGSANCLLFDHRVPLRFEDMYPRCTSEVQSGIVLKIHGQKHAIRDEYSSLTYPTAPVPMVMSNTIRSGTLSNPRRARCRSALDTEPSIRRQSIL